MPAWQFETHLNPDQTFTVPPEIVAHLKPDETVQVFVTTAETNDESEWIRMATEQFLQGYGPGDDIYDQLSPG